jgi:hypothetical protein
VRLARIGAVGGDRPVVVLDDQQVVDVTDVVSDLTSAAIADGALERLTPELLEGRPARPLEDNRIGPPVAGVVNDEPRQRGTSADMIFGVSTLIEYISQFMMLNPGDVVLTGTPSGVALGMPTPQPAGPPPGARIYELSEQHQTVTPAP